MIIFALIFFYLAFKFGSREGASESDMLKVQAFKTYFFLVGLFFLLASQLIMINDVSLINKTSSMGFITDMLWFILAIMVICFCILFILMLKDAINLIAQKKLIKIRW
jgi:TRAP-type C4-dicarboxylate transport system permease small subunit